MLVQHFCWVLVPVCCMQMTTFPFQRVCVSTMSLVRACGDIVPGQDKEGNLLMQNHQGSYSRSSFILTPAIFF